MKADLSKLTTASGTIEITAEMLARGVAAFMANRSLEYETEEEAVEIILKATLGDLAVFPQ